MSTDLKSKIQQDLKVAMKAGNKEKVSALRLMLAAIKQKEIDSRKKTDNSEVVSILGKMAKQRRDSISQYLNASRNDLASIEENELKLINSYLPQQLSEDEIYQFVETAIREVEAKTPRDIGKVMAKLKNELKGKADMALVSKTVKDCL